MKNDFKILDFICDVKFTHNIYFKIYNCVEQSSGRKYIVLHKMCRTFGAGNDPNNKIDDVESNFVERKCMYLPYIVLDKICSSIGYVKIANNSTDNSV